MTRLGRFVRNVFLSIFGVAPEWKGNIFSTILDWYAATLARFIAIVMENIESEMIPVLKKQIEQMELSGELPPEIKPITDEIKKPTKQIAAIFGSSAASTMTGGILSSSIGPGLKKMEYFFSRKAQQYRYDLKTALAVYIRTVVDNWSDEAIGNFKFDPTHWIFDDLRDQGWSDKRISNTLSAVTTRLKEDFLLSLKRRGKITPGNYTKRMISLGYTQAEAADFALSQEEYPGVQDLVRMAVREVFNPQARLDLMLDSEFPGDFGKFAEQIGLSDEWAKNFWAAHWVLPSVREGFEMMHRDIIKPPQLDALLKALDYSPAWREKLAKLSYSPFTRVDIRRMHKLGILTREQVRQSYKDIGYNDEKAEALTQFTLALNAGTATDAEKELSKAEILKAYKNRLISETEARDALANLGYDDAAIFLLIGMSQGSATLATRDLTLTQIQSLYQKGLRTKAECNTFLIAFGFSSAEITALYSLWDWEAPNLDRLPSRTDLDNFVSAGVISLDQWSDEYTLLGYDLKYQEWYYAYLVEKGKVEG